MTRPPGYLARLGTGAAAAVRRPLVRSGAGLGALTAADVGFGLISAVLLARELGAEGLGFYALAMAVAALAGLPVEFGLPNLVTREVAHARAATEAGAAKGVIVFAVAVIGAMSAVLVPAVLIIGVTPAVGLGVEARTILPLAVLLIPINALGRVLGAALAGRQRVALGALPQRLVRPGTFALMLALAALAEPGWLSPARAVALQAAASGLALAVAGLLFARHFARALRQNRASVAWQTWLAAMLRLGFAAALMQAQPQVLLLLTGALSSLENVGLLRIAQRGVGLVASAAAIAVLAAAPRMVALHAEGRQARLQQLVTQVARIAFAVALVGLTGFALAGQWLLAALFGSDFVAAWSALLILSLGATMRGFHGPAAALMNVLRREAETLRAWAMALAVSTVVAVVLLPWLGHLGAALGFLAGHVVAFVFLRRRVRRELGLDPVAFPVLHIPENTADSR